jgi:hypothetical protein
MYTDSPKKPPFFATLNGSFPKERPALHGQELPVGRFDILPESSHFSARTRVRCQRGRHPRT